MTEPQLLLTGELTFATVSQFLERSDQLLDGGVLDMSRVTRADSAGLALLLELTRRQRAKGSELQVVRADPAIVRMAEFFGLDEVLRFQDGGGQTIKQGDVA
jgi:phospholipid transport system transporter-binding protein